MTIDKTVVERIINNTRGKVFSLQFTKKDGSQRVMNCRLGVSKGVKGTGYQISNNIPVKRVYDMNAKGFRSINLSTILWIKAGGLKYDII